ncbi:DEAD/DEAH box helicase [Amycolatopsis japonica]|uniref:DEAD/DEAH box helicase n=1 Tax=Amycolatopsis japonica TaxID=208439 RepID=UPI00366B204D
MPRVPGTSESGDPASDEFHDLKAKLTANGVDWRAVRYLVDDEIVTHRVAQISECYLARSARRQPFSTTGQEATVAGFVFCRTLSFNPSQAEAVPPILGDSSHVVVVAPTGAGKTTVGMVSAFRAVVGEGRKAAWLVPQRSLTDELDRELDHWRREGLRGERLSGEYSVDVERVREADVWGATTEKFEAMCRASSLREALAEVACLIVDEIHLLGDPERGPVLEALLARMRGDDQVRIVGLSAAVANAYEIAAWLGARLVRVAWRPSTLTWRPSTLTWRPSTLTWRPSTLTWQLPVIATHRDGHPGRWQCTGFLRKQARRPAHSPGDSRISRGCAPMAFTPTISTGCTKCAARPGSASTTRAGTTNGRRRRRSARVKSMFSSRRRQSPPG